MMALSLYLKNKPQMSSNALILAEVHGFLPPMPKCSHSLLTPHSANTDGVYKPACLSCREGCMSLSGIIHSKYPNKMPFEAVVRHSECIWDPVGQVRPRCTYSCFLSASQALRGWMVTLKPRDQTSALVKVWLSYAVIFKQVTFTLCLIIPTYGAGSGASKKRKDY